MSNSRTWIKFEIQPDKKKQFKDKCSSLGIDMSTWIRNKINDFLKGGLR